MTIFGQSRIRNRGRGSANTSAALLPFALGLAHCGGSFQPTPPPVVDAGEAASPDAPDAMAIYVAPIPEAGVTVVPSVVDAGVPDGALAPDASTAAAAAIDASGGSADAVAMNCDSTRAPKDDPCVIADTYAVFVSNSGGDAGAAAGSALGTMANPVPTVSQGVALAASSGKSRVYVCGGQYTESVAISSGVSLYGGFTCPAGSWQWVGAKTAVTAPAAPSAGSFVLALSIGSPNAPVLVEDMTFASPDAVGQDALGNGISSIAAYVDATTVTFVRTILSAGKGASGADGVTGVRSATTIAATNYLPIGTPNQPSVAPAGGPNTPGSITCNYVDPTRMPLAPDSSSGGLPATNGTSNPPPVITASTPPGRYGLSSAQVSVPESGEDGPARPGGVAASSAWTLTAAGGWSPAMGGDGPAGEPGQGGGGFNGCEADDFEGGGSGGCGGAGGTAGGAGGSSIALLSVGSTISISGSALRASAGGNGGVGGSGQDGQTGGPGAVGSCSTPSGNGGNGAGGSGGAGGSAGESIGILYAQSGLPSYNTADTSIAVSAPGVPGMGGQPGGGPGTAGNPGQAGYLSPQASAPYLLAP